MAGEAPQAEPVVTPSPVSMTMNVVAVKSTEGDTFLQLTIATPVGSAVYFMSREEAVALGQLLQKQALQANGLHVVDGVHPNGHG